MTEMVRVEVRPAPACAWQPRGQLGACRQFDGSEGRERGFKGAGGASMSVDVDQTSDVVVSVFGAAE